MTSLELIKIKKVIFWDFDGVIKDSVSVKVESFCKLFESYGTDIVDKIRVHNQNNGGMSRFEKFPIYLNWVGEKVSDNRIKDLNQQFSQLVLDAVINSEWIPGVESYLRNNYFNQTFVLVSATPLTELRIILENLDLTNIFKLVYGSPTSKEASILSALDILGIPFGDTVMIGDSMADKNAADFCKIPFILKKSELNSKIFNNYNGHSIIDLTEK